MFRVDVEITEGLTYVIVVNVEQFINVPLPIFVIDDGINIDVKCVQFSKQKFPIDVQIEPMSTLAKYPPPGIAYDDDVKVVSLDVDVVLSE